MKNIWLIGTGGIGMEYSRVLDSLEVDQIVIGRGDSSAQKFEENRPGKKVVRGGLGAFLQTKPTIPDGAIVAVGYRDLYDVTKALLLYGVKNIFVEKPGADSWDRIRELSALSKEQNANVFLAYNRRFFASLLKAEEIIQEDGGITSFHFEFTEWLHVIEAAYGNTIQLQDIFFGNSGHVLDMAFFLGGFPKEMSSFVKTLPGEQFPKIFAGAGTTEKDALFSYEANWDAPGRWVVEVLTSKHRLYFKPLETLQIQELKTVRVNPVEIDDHLDKEFKPGFYLETKAFVEGDYSRLCTIHEQAQKIDTLYRKIAGEL